MLVDLRHVLFPAHHRRYAVGSFNAFNLETATGIVEAAEESMAPVVLALSARHAANVSLTTFASAARSLGTVATVPVVLHLDHSRTIELIADALDAGFTSVMFDGAGLPYEAKLEETSKVVDLAHSRGASAEAELEHIGRLGVEDGEGLTSASRAREFAELTRIDCLAVSIGTKHGLAAGQSRIDFKLLQQLRGEVPCFLSLHGGSGVSADELTRVAALGISKISYFTALSRASLELVHSLSGSAGASDLQAVLLGVQTGFREGCLEAIRVFGSHGHATDWTEASQL